MTNEGIKIITGNLQARIAEAKQDSTYNRKRIFSRARYIYKNSACSWSDALTQSWYESKKCVLPARFELEQLKSDLMDIYKPVEYKHLNTTESVNRIMNEAFNEGATMN